MEYAGFPEQYGPELGVIKKALAKVVKAREEDFLGLGTAVQRFALASSDLSRAASELAEATNAAAVEAIVGRLGGELDDLARQSDAEVSRSNIGMLDEVDGHVHTLAEAVGEFKGVIRRLQMLGISTRIESARLGSKGRGFTTLADDVERLAVNIETHSKDILGRSRSLAKSVQDAKGESESMCRQQEEAARTHMARMREDMAALADMARTSESVSADLSRHTAGIAAHVGEIIASVQFHDITRQQVEHVEESLDEISVVFHEHKDRREDQAVQREIVGWCGDVCALQASQLGHAGRLFGQAVERIRANLRTVAGGVEEVASTAGVLTGGGDHSAVSALDRMETSIQGLIGGMRAHVERGGAIGRLMASVASTVADMGRFLLDIEEVGTEIELIALNASIKAAHTGDEGKALGVLATSIQGLSISAREQTEGVTAVLRTVGSLAETLKASAESFMDTAQVTAIIERLEGFVTELRGGNRSLVRISGDIRTRSNALASDIVAFADGLTFHEDVAREIAEVGARIRAVGESALALAPHDGSAARSERLQRMLDRYTMEAERLVHDSVSTGARHSDAELFAATDVELFSDDAQGPPSAGDDDLGDNVELF
ncbi:MAG: methyl-accepting chemotaxis protein [Desulfovibrionaceae bacterium]|jgi:methyl-accepting chemotaxis protein|nr:methyl-accepting chemotaxis protein [Desulfovibrionaceae bacterium]